MSEPESEDRSFANHFSCMSRVANHQVPPQTEKLQIRGMRFAAKPSAKSRLQRASDI
jgi:hypothetical protein